MKHFKRERHAEGYLFKLLRTGVTVVGVTNKGAILAAKDEVRDFSDDEWLELMRETSNLSESIKGIPEKPKDFYWSISEKYALVKLIRLEADKREGQQYAEVELTQNHKWRGKAGDVVLWLWQDLTPVPSFD